MQHADAFDLLDAPTPFSSHNATRRPLADLVDATLKAAARSDHTKRVYTTAIGLFLQFLDVQRGELLPDDVRDAWRPFARSQAEKICREDKHLATRTSWTFRGPCAVLRLVDAGLLDAFSAWRETEGDGRNAVTTRIAAVRSFLSVALRDGVLTVEQAQSMRLRPYRSRQKRCEQPVGRRLLPAEVRALRKTLDPATNKGTRDRALLDVMLYAGLRREEVAMLTTSNFIRSAGYWWIVFSGKGDKKRRIKVHEMLHRSLKAWLKCVGLTLGDGCEAIFRSINKGDVISERQLNSSAIARIVAECGCAAGLAPLDGENRLSPHDLRRTFARNAFDNGSNLLQVQAILGHSDPKTTARYIGAFEDEEDTAVDYVGY